MLLCMRSIWLMLGDHLKSDLQWCQFQNLFMLGMFPFHTTGPWQFPKLLLQAKRNSVDPASRQERCNRLSSPVSCSPGPTWLPYPGPALQSTPQVHLLTSPRHRSPSVIRGRCLRVTGCTWHFLLPTRERSPACFPH